MVELQKMLTIINEVVEMFLQEISIPKTKFMRVIRLEEKDEDKIGLTLIGEMIDEVSDFKYLGLHESSNGKMEIEVAKRLTHMRIAYGRYIGKIFKNRNLTVKNILTLFNTFVSIVALYGSATWCLTDVLITGLEKVHFKLLRAIVPGTLLF